MLLWRTAPEVGDGHASADVDHRVQSQRRAIRRRRRDRILIGRQGRLAGGAASCRGRSRQARENVPARDHAPTVRRSARAAKAKTSRNGVFAAMLWRRLAARSGGLSPAENSSRGARAAFVVVDWGTSSFRGWLMSADGEALAESRGGEGMLHCAAGGAGGLRAGAARSPRAARRAGGSARPDLRHGGRAAGLGRSTLSQDTDAARCPARGRHPDRRARRHPHPARHRPGAAPTGPTSCAGRRPSFWA